MADGDLVIIDGTTYTEQDSTLSSDTLVDHSTDDLFLFSGDWGADTIIKGHGNDSGGTDALDFGSALSGVTVDLKQGQGGFATDYATATDHAADETAGPNSVVWGSNVKIENVFGSDFGDWIRGSQGNGDANLLDGRGGNDTLYGGSGDDTLIGGFGNDYMDGGMGNDTYVFNHITSGGTVYNTQTDNHAHWLLRFSASDKITAGHPNTSILPPGQLNVHWITDTTKYGGHFSDSGIQKQFLAYWKDFTVNATDHNGLGGHYTNTITEKLWEQVKVTDWDTHHIIIANETDIINDAGGLHDVVDFSNIAALSSTDALASWKFAHDAANAGNLEILMGDGGHLLTVQNYFTADGTGHWHGETESFHFASGADVGFTDVSAHALNHTYDLATHEYH